MMPYETPSSGRRLPWEIASPPAGGGAPLNALMVFASMANAHTMLMLSTPLFFGRFVVRDKSHRLDHPFDPTCAKDHGKDLSGGVFRRAAGPGEKESHPFRRIFRIPTQSILRHAFHS